MIATLRDVKREGNPSAVGDTSNDAYLLAALRQVERRFVALAGFDFVPRRRSLTIYDGDRYGHFTHNGQRLALQVPLLAVESVYNGLTLLASDAYRAVPLHLGSTSPIAALHLAAGTWIGDGMGVSITGVWGYHTDYSAAWVSSLDALQADINEIVTVLPVGSAAGPDAFYNSPRFSPGQVIRIDDEWLEVLAVDGETDTLTVRRGVNGSTAAAHADDAPIDVWYADPQAVRAVSRWTALAHNRRGAFETLKVRGMETISFPADAPDEVQRIIAGFRDLFDQPFLEV